MPARVAIRAKRNRTTSKPASRSWPTVRGPRRTTGEPRRGTPGVAVTPRWASAGGGGDDGGRSPEGLSGADHGEPDGLVISDDEAEFTGSLTEASVHSARCGHHGWDAAGTRNDRGRPAVGAGVSVLRVSVVVPAPPDRVWADLSDLSTHVEWMRDAESIDFVSERTSGVGTVFDCATTGGALPAERPDGDHPVGRGTRHRGPPRRSGHRRRGDLSSATAERANQGGLAGTSGLPLVDGRAAGSVGGDTRVVAGVAIVDENAGRTIQMSASRFEVA